LAIEKSQLTTQQRLIKLQQIRLIILEM